jgi:hypothetical protein
MPYPIRMLQLAVKLQRKTPLFIMTTPHPKQKVLLLLNATLYPAKHPAKYPYPPCQL